MCMQEVKTKAVLAALGVVLMSFGQAANAAIILFSDFRNIEASAAVFTENVSLNESSSNTSSNFSDFDDSVEVILTSSDGSASAVAQQTSQINETSTLASGGATISTELTVLDSTSGPIAEAGADTFFSAGIELTTPYQIDLSGILGSSDLSGNVGRAFVQLSNPDNGLPLLYVTTGYGSGETIPFGLSQTLSPGTYFLEANAYFSGSTHFDQPEALNDYSNFSLDMQFTPVPIPASLLLFGSGLLSLVGIARRKKA